MGSHLSCNADFGLLCRQPRRCRQDLPPSTSTRLPSTSHISGTVLPFLARMNEAHGQSSVLRAKHLLGCVFLFGNKMPSRCLYSIPRLVGAGFLNKSRLNQRRGADDLWLPAVQTQQRTCLTYQRGLRGKSAPQAGTFPTAEPSSPWVLLFPC